MTEPVRTAVIYYSATGSVHAMASRAAQTAEKAGAEVRLRRVQELAPPAAIAANKQWAEHAKATAGVETATPADMEWADLVLLGTPTRFGGAASQLKQFLDQLGPQWAQGKLADKVYAGFVSASTRHGGQESTLLALFNARCTTSAVSWSHPVTPTRASSRTEIPTGSPTSARTVATRLGTCSSLRSTT